MNLTLKRDCSKVEGIFGTLFDENDIQVAVTLEHAYELPGPDPDAAPLWVPKLAAGVYQCVRGQHQLEGMKAPFTTFEITGVPPFQGKPVTGILFHVGNADDDSAGCVLLGLKSDGTDIYDSRAAFGEFLDLQEGVDAFTLTVTS